MRITERSLARLCRSPSPDRRVLLFDDTLRGFAVRRYPTGRLVYVAFWRTLGGRVRARTLGVVGELPEPEARERARAEIARGTLGIEVNEIRPRRLPDVTVRDLTERYFDLLDKRGTSPARLSRLFSAFVLPAIGDRPVQDVCVAELEAIHLRVFGERTRSTSTRLLAGLNGLFDLGVRCRLIDHSPAHNVRHFRRGRPTGFCLRPDEFLSLKASAEASYWTFPSGMIRLAMFTGCNFNELRSLTWDTVFLDDGMLVTCGAHRNGPRRVYLNTFALDMLGTFQRLRGQRLVFPNTKGQPIHRFTKSWAAIVQKAGLQFFPPQLLRKNYASTMAGAGVSIDLIAALMGYRSLCPLQAIAAPPVEALRAASERFVSAIEADFSPGGPIFAKPGLNSMPSPRAVNHIDHMFMGSDPRDAD